MSNLQSRLHDAIEHATTLQEQLANLAEVVVQESHERLALERAAASVDIAVFLLMQADCGEPLQPQESWPELKHDARCCLIPQCQECGVPA